MATTKPENLQPVCRVPGCKEGAQLYSQTGLTATWMKTCRRHTYKDLPEEQTKVETFWPPSNTQLASKYAVYILRPILKYYAGIL